MNTIKIFGLVGLTALVAAAFAGASSAMAEPTNLCDEDSSPCPAGHRITHIHESTLAGAKAKLLGSANIECDVLFLGAATSGWDPLIIEGTFTYTNCGANCSVTEVYGPTIIELSKAGHETAVGFLYGLSLEINCNAIVCNYAADNGFLAGTATGPLLSSETNGSISVSGGKLVKASDCLLGVSSLKLDIVTTPLNATYITN